MKNYLAVNTGSASKKYALYDESGQELWRAHFEKEGKGFIVNFQASDRSEKIEIKKKDFDNAIAFLLARRPALRSFSEGEADSLAVAGVRVVAPGEYFSSNRSIDERFLKKLEAAAEQAPLHIAPALTEIKQLRKIFPDLPMIAVSDSAFSAEMPDHSRLYSLPESIAAKLGIYRYGYHGISLRSIVGKVEKMLGRMPSRVVICHLGSGSTVAAVRDGKCFDTSMGFTPLEGIPMGTRIGNIDAGAVIYLAKKSRLSLEKLEDFFNKECGLLGLSGKTADVRELLELEEKSDKKSARALEIFVYHIKKYIGAYAAAMGGLDLLVFTATIGERSFIIRRRICTGLENLGVALDEIKNNATVSVDGFIGTANSSAKVAVIPTDEMGEIYRSIIR